MFEGRLRGAVGRGRVRGRPADVRRAERKDAAWVFDEALGTQVPPHTAAAEARWMDVTGQARGSAGFLLVNYTAEASGRLGWRRVEVWFDSKGRAERFEEQYPDAMPAEVVARVERLLLGPNIATPVIVGAMLLRAEWFFKRQDAVDRMSTIHGISHVVQRLLDETQEAAKDWDVLDAYIVQPDGQWDWVGEASRDPDSDTWTAAPDDAVDGYIRYCVAGARPTDREFLRVPVEPDGHVRRRQFVAMLKHNPHPRYRWKPTEKEAADLEVEIEEFKEEMESPPEDLEEQSQAAPAPGGTGEG